MSQSDTRERMKSELATKFGVLRGICYPDISVTGSTYTPDAFSRSTRIHAKTDGRRLTKVNLGFFQKKDIETCFNALLHEVTHANNWSSHGRGDSAHDPEFWEELARNFNTILNSQTHRRVVENLFETTLNHQFDWHRAKYRAVQSVSQVDNRSETLDERQEKLAAAIGYDTYNEWDDSDWGVTSLVNNPYTISNHECVQVNMFIHDQRFADDYSDEELLAFAEEYDGRVPMPIIVLDEDWEYKRDGPQILRDDEQWRLATRCKRESKMALAVRERLGLPYAGLSGRLLQMTSDWGDALEHAAPDEKSELVSDVVTNHIQMRR
jgi:hypothetical protein